ncbi:Nucleolar protein 16 [Lecanora helva]
MARPLQKKKNKSSRPRVRQKPKSKRINIKSNPIVAANWDSSLTLSQNYHRLGLSSKLKAYTGGTEPKITKTTNSQNARKPALAIPSSKAPKTLGNDEVKVIRDPRTGAITSIVPSTHENEKKARKNPLNDPLNDLSDSSEQGYGDEDEGGEEVNRGIVPELEESAKYEKKKRPRTQSEQEREWCWRLVERWGDDWGGMVRDRKLNPMQQGEGDLRRRVGLWKRRAGV